jgi:hypothetical protein
MGRLGRSVLYASVVLALSVSAVGAAAQESIPGDPLYGVKLRLEDVRMHVAPTSARAELAEIALAERADELERLAAAGAWRLVPAAATRLTEARQELIELDPSTRERAASGQLGAVDVLEAVLAEAPPAARAGLERALQAVQPPASTGREETGAGQSPLGPDSATPGSSGQHNRQGGAPGATDNRNPRADDTGRPPEAPPNDSSQRGGAQGSQKAPDAPGKGGGQSGQGQSGQGDQRGGPPASPLS